MSTDLRKLEIKIDAKVLLYIAVIIAILTFAWTFRAVIVMFFIAYIINSSLRPIVNRLEKRRIPRSLSISALFLLIFVVFSLFGIFSTNTFVSQMQNLTNAIPNIALNMVDFVEDNAPALAEVLPLEAFRTEVSTLAAGAEESTFFSALVNQENLIQVVAQAYGIFGGVLDLMIQLFTIMVVSAYLLSRKDSIYQPLVNLIPTENKEALSRTLHKIDRNLGSWLLGQLALMVFIGVATYIVLMFPSLFFDGYRLHLYALPIAIIASFLEIIPNLGPFLTMIFAGIIALGTSGFIPVIYVAIMFTILQNVQAVFVAPQVMKRALGIDPIVSILAIIGALQVYGVIGAVLVIPVIAIIKIVVTEIIEEYKQQQKN
jgi:predicted PurR-regulated permease PerM